MATHEDIGLSQPAASTTTHRLDAVSLDQNSTIVLREVLVVGSPETTNALAAVLNGVPASTEWGLAVRAVGYSTVVSVAALPSNSSQVEVRAMPAGSTSVTIAAITGPVSTGAPATGDTGLVVRQVGYSTIVSVAALPANSSQVEVRAMPANSSVVAVGSFAAGLQSSAAAAGNSSALLVRVVGGPSSAADFNQIVSSVGGVVSVSPNSTGWVKNAGLSVDSSNYLNVNASFSGSTDVSVSKLPAGLLSSAAPAGNSSALLVRLVGGPSSAGDAAITVHGNVSSNSSVYLPVRLTNGTAFLQPAVDYTHASTLTPSTVTGPTVLYRASDTTPAAVSTADMWVVPWASKLGALKTNLVTSSGVGMDDSTNAALRVNVVAGATSGPTSTAAPASNDTGLVVRQVGYSTVVTVAAMPAGSTSVTLSALAAGLQSSAAAAGNSSALLVRVVGGPSSAADFTQIVSSVAGIVAVRPSDTNWASSAGFHFDSSGALNVAASFSGSTDVSISKLPAGLLSSAAPAGNSSALLVRLVGGPSSAGDVSINVANFSTTVSVAAMPANSSLVSVTAFPSAMVSTSAPAHGSSALLVRDVGSSLQSTTVTITSSNSTAVYTLLSSVAGNQRVYAYFIGASTSANHSTVLIGNSTNPTLWGVIMSSAVFGANMAVHPSGFLFESGAGNPLNVRIESAAVVTARVSLSYKID